METKSKLLVVVALMLLGLTTATIVNISLNFRNYSIQSSIDKAKMAALFVKDGLTSHMVNGIMDKREYFLDQITRNNDIKSLWIVRSPKVTQQYGDGFANESIRDAIDKEVIQSGESVQKITENAKESILRITIPYKAEIQSSSLNCLQCHDVKKGDILGAISMEFDVSDMRSDGMLTILKILGINIIFLLIALFLVNYYATPYMKLFTTMQDGIKRAYTGDFTHKFFTTLGGDAQKVISQMNTLFAKMQETFGDIKYNLATFRPNECTSNSDPLYEAKSIISELSDIYKFKKTIELDATKDVIYSRIIDILKLKYKLHHFAFYEINSKTLERNLIYITEGSTFCSSKADKNAMECRAYRTKTDVISTEFPNLCKACVADEDISYLCIPYVINNESSIVISISSHSPEEINKIKLISGGIENYLEAAKPVIESKLLMDKLRDISLRDGMTGLYNRRFLEGFIDKIASQASRRKDTYSIMMADVDFFKMVNDTYGHDVGDKVIVALANVFKENIREADMAIRYGGEEFIIMLHNATNDGTMVVAEKIHEAFGKLEFDVGNGEKLKKTISIGIAHFPSDADSIWKCIKYADTALYKAKNTGRNKIVEFTADMYEGEDF